MLLLLFVSAQTSVEAQGTFKVFKRLITECVDICADMICRSILSYILNYILGNMLTFELSDGFTQLKPMWCGQDVWLANYKPICCLKSSMGK